MSTPDRYGKQTLLPEIGPAGQQRLARARVLCIGAGGLGCAILPYLAGAGVGQIVISDPDRVARDNLQRQVLYAESDMGRAKAEVAAERLAALNSEIEVEALSTRVDASNIESLLSGCHLVIDGSDNYPTKYLAGDASVKFGVPLVYGSATGMEAMVTVFSPGNGPCLRCLFPSPPEGWVPNCAEAGVLGPLVGLAGAVQAAEAIKLLVDDPRLQPLIGRLWLVDARDLQVRRLQIRRRNDCPTCSRPPERIVLAAPVSTISPEQLAALSPVTLIDVREPAEFTSGHLPGAINLPLSKLAEATALPTTPHWVVYCQTGPRAQAAAERLQHPNGGRISCLEGGLAAWPHPLTA